MIFNARTGWELLSQGLKNKSLVGKQREHDEYVAPRGPWSFLRRIAPMSPGPILAWCMALMSAGASIGYFYAGDIRRALYWLFALGITAVVTWE